MLVNRTVMNYKIIGLIGALALVVSCKHPDRQQLTKDYYQALNENNFTRIMELQYDSVRVKEGEFLSIYSPTDYVHWLQWDSVFQPTYKLLDLTPVPEGIEITVSKDDERIQFLNGEPLITKERLLFNEGKIHSLEILEYVAFHNEKWNAKREVLVTWIDENHPELNGFINDQTLQGGLNYRRALELFHLGNRSSH